MKVSTDSSDSIGSIFDIIDGYGEELNALESSHSDAHNRANYAERVHCNGSNDSIKAREQSGQSDEKRAMEGC